MEQINTRVPDGKAKNVKELAKDKPVDNDAFLKMMDYEYTKLKLQNRPPADLDAVNAVRQAVKEGTREDVISYPVVITDGSGYALSKSSWEECLDFYECASDIIARTGMDIDKMVELEIWFVNLIEPLHQAKLWFEEERNKYTNCHSKYANYSYRPLIKFKMSEKITPEWWSLHVIKLYAVLRFNGHKL